MIRSIWIWGNLLAVTIIKAGIVVVAAMLGVQGRVYDWAARSWAAWVLRVSHTPVRVEGLEHVHLDRPQIFVSNHQSWYDVWALAVAIPKRYRFVAKKELEKIPLFGRAWKAAGHIRIDRGDRSSAIESLEEAGKLLRQDNSSVVIFPEGTRSLTGQLQNFKKGAFMLALHTGAEIVPTAVVGTHEILPKRAWRVRPGPIIVRFGNPLPTTGYTESNRDALISDVRSRIEALLTAPRPARRVS